MNAIKKLGMAGLVMGLLAVAMGAWAAPVNINTADARTLAQNIKGVGPKKAAAIVVYRRENGPFKTINDLARVKGIGEKLVAKNKTDLFISDAAMKNPHR